MNFSTFASASAILSAAILATPSTAADKAQTGVGLSSQWQQKSGVISRGPDGQIIYLYGETQPTVVCSPLQLCEVQLEAGEAVRDVLVGDTVRWQIEPASSGSEKGQRISLIVKPAESGLKTSMVVTTSRRTYHINLVSDSRRYMARVAFQYPGDTKKQFEAVNRQVEESSGIAGSVPADRLNFDFAVSGFGRWQPQRIYTDGVKTYIQFSGWLASGDAPVLFVVAGGQNQVVNYRMHENMMIVDYLIDNAILVSGVGWFKEKITIQRRS